MCQAVHLEEETPEKREERLQDLSVRQAVRLEAETPEIMLVFGTFYNFLDVFLIFLDQHNYPPVQYNEHFGLLK